MAAMGFFDMFKKEPPSGEIAKKRLQFALYHDRLKCEPQVLEMLKTDIINVISKYMDIDEEKLDITVPPLEEGGDGIPVLTADIPIKGWKRNVTK